jgi:hypothetical protein
MQSVQLGLLIIWLGISTYYIPYSLAFRNLNTIKFLTVALMLQNLMSLFASNTLSNIISQYLILYKEIILWGTVIVVFIQNFKIKKSSLPILIFVLYIIICFVRSDSTLYTRLVCFRQIMTPVILILYGRSLNITDSDKVKYLSFLVKLGVFQAVFGLIELFILGDSFWLSINISKLFETKGFTGWAFDGLPGNYYSYDFYYIIGKSIRRLVGITTDPLLTAHYLALCIIILLFTKIEINPIKRSFIIVLMSIAVLLTISKGAILIIVIAYTYKLWIYNRKLSYMVISLVIMLGLVVVSSNIFSTISTHLAGFATGLSSLSLFGSGIGTAGNLASLAGSNTSIGESYFGMILGQMGLLGLVLFVWMIYEMCKIVLKRDRNVCKYAIVAYILAVMVEAIASESAINFVGSGCAFIILGYYTIEKCYGKVVEVGKNENRNINIPQSV